MTETKVDLITGLTFELTADGTAVQESTDQNFVVKEFSDDVEQIAQQVFEAMRFSAQRVNEPKPPEWVSKGNSFMQDHARDVARAIIARTRYADHRGVLPMIVSETGADDEPEIKRIICAWISGGADYVYNMPRELGLERITPDGSIFANYVQADLDIRPPTSTPPPARVAAADGPAVPEDGGPASVTGQPSDENCWQWYTYCPEEGLEMYLDKKQAQSAAQSIMGSYEVAAYSDGWHEDMESVSWGMLVPIERAQVVERKTAGPGDEFDEWVKYELMPARYGHQPAPPAEGEVGDGNDWFTVALVAQDMRSRGLAEQVAGDELLKMANCNRSRRAPLEADGPAVPEGREPASVTGQPSNRTRRVCIWSPTQMAECGGPCWEAQDPSACDCGALWMDVPEDREPASVAGQPSDEELRKIWETGHLPTDEELANDDGEQDLQFLFTSDYYRWLEENPEAMAEHESKCIRAVFNAGRRFGHHPAPPAEGEVAGLVADLRMMASQAAGSCQFTDAENLSRTADLLEQRHPAPVPAAERLPELRGMFERILCVARSSGQRPVGNIELANRLIKAVVSWSALTLPAGEAQP